MGSGSQNESKCQKLAPIREKKIFHELDVHHVYKVGMKRFWAQEVKMSLSSESSLQSTRRKFFILLLLLYIMSRSWNQTFLGSAGQNESKRQKLSRIGEKKIFHELDVHHV